MVKVIGRFTFFVFVFNLMGCDTLSIYRDPAFPAANEQTSFIKKDKGEEVELSGRVSLFNYNMTAWLNINNLSSKKLVIAPEKVLLKSTTKNQTMELKSMQVKEGQDFKKVSLADSVEIGPGETKSLVFNYNPTPLMPPLHIMSKPDLQKLTLIVGGLKRSDRQLKDFLIPLETKK
ncbi:MAG: hypothetical protein SGJ18_00320 [Pseudomonadota bacterium]|nr:hypothetical protein [Pseudomonadota bacterium]